MRTKITSGFIAVIAVFLLAVILSVLSLMEASDGFTQYRTLARHSNLAGELQANMLMARMNVKDFIIQGDEAEYREYQEYFDEMERDLAQAKTEITEPERQAQIQEADSRVASYGQAFTRLHDEVNTIEDLLENSIKVLGTRAQSNLTEILTTSEADDDMDAAYEASMALRSLLLAELHVIEYVEDSSNESYATAARNELDTAEEFLNNMNGLLNDSRRLQLLSLTGELVGEYEDAFEQIYRSLQNRDDLVDNQLDVLGPEIAQDVDEVKVSLIAEQDELGPRLQANNRRTIVHHCEHSPAAGCGSRRHRYNNEYYFQGRSGD
jgi:methyl-accepting chemotaxis protein